MSTDFLTAVKGKLQDSITFLICWLTPLNSQIFFPLFAVHVLIIFNIFIFLNQRFGISITIDEDVVLPGKRDEAHGNEETDEEETTKDKNENDEYTPNTLVDMDLEHYKQIKY